MTDLSLIASLWFAMIGFWLIGDPLQLSSRCRTDDDARSSFAARDGDNG